MDISRMSIMCGRLSKPAENNVQVFPVDTWKEEFSACKELGISSIEWLFDADTYRDNPILSSSGREEIKKMVEQHGVHVDSLMAHYFIENKLYGISDADFADNFAMLSELLACSVELGIKFVEIPLLEESEFQSEDEKEEFVCLLKQRVAPFLKKNGVILGLETSLNTMDFMELLRKIDHSHVKAVFDMGNSASYGYDAIQEITMLAPWIASVHIKDRVKDSASVRLSQGCVDFKKVFDSLNNISYRGKFIFEAYMGGPDKTSDDRKQIMENYLEFINSYI